MSDDISNRELLEEIKKFLKGLVETEAKEKCFYPNCKREGKSKCVCGDHSYGPDYSHRQYGGYMCQEHAKDHGSCAGWGHW